MRKMMIAAAALAMMILSAGSALAAIDMEQAVDIALSAAGIRRENAFDVDVEWKGNAAGGGAYEVEFRSGSMEYEYWIDAETGKILHSKKEWD